MEELTYNKGRTKKDLVGLYISQYSEKDIRFYINEIIREYRPKKNIKAKNISVRELITFVELYGLPKGYLLGEELKEMRKDANIKM